MSEEKKGIADAENGGTTETMADYARELEASFRTIREGDVISGTVIDVRETGVTLDLGYYAPAVIKTEDLSRDPSFSVLADIHVGDTLEGTVVKRASLCNISECERLGIGEEGTQISVIKANKIIPKVIAVKKTEGGLHIPDICPVCGTKTEIHISEVSGTKTLRCTNPDCDAKKLRKYARFVSKGGVDMDGISEMTLSRFINEGWIHTYGDIYRLLIIWKKLQLWMGLEKNLLLIWKLLFLKL